MENRGKKKTISYKQLLIWRVVGFICAAILIVWGIVSHNWGMVALAVLLVCMGIGYMLLLRQMMQKAQAAQRESN